MVEQNRTSLSSASDRHGGGLPDVVASGTRLLLAGINPGCALDAARGVADHAGLLAGAARDAGLVASPSAGPSATNQGWLPA